MKTLLLFLLYTTSLWGQLNSFVSVGSRNTKVYNSKINLDGFVNEDLWQGAIKYGDFKQTNPSIGEKGTERTEVLIIYDKQNLYVAFKSYQANIENIFGSVLERDKNLSSDDYVELIIDSRNDNTNALSFQTNIFGTRTDKEISGGGSVFNYAWNTFWDVASAKTNFGWSTEFKIPFSSLRYKENEINTMRLKFIRHIRAKSEIDIFPLNKWNIDNPLYNLINSVSIELKALPSNSPIYFTPYVIADIKEHSVFNANQTEYKTSTELLNRKNYFSSKIPDKILSNIGFDLKYKPDNSNTLDLTLNTDFAQVESNDRIINLTRYSISLPEKRTFFLENADLFNSNDFDHRLFHSRRIGIENGENVPLIGGLRFTGAVGDLQYGIMSIQSNGIKSKNIESKNFTVARVKQGFNNNDSFIGGVFTNKESTGNLDFNRLAGLDGFIRVDNSITTSFFAASSFEKNNNNFHNYAYGIKVNRFAQTGFAFQYRFREYGENFNPELGFLPRPNTQRLTIDNGYRFSFQENPIFSRIYIGQWNTFYWNSTTGVRQFFQINPYAIFYFSDGSYAYAYTPMYQEDRLFKNWHFSDNIIIPKETYKMFRGEFYYVSGNSNNYSYTLYTTFGDFYGGTQYSISGNMSFILNRNFNFEFNVNYNRLVFPSSYSNNNNPIDIRILYSTKLNYFLSSQLSFKAFLQYDNKSKVINSNIRLRYNPKEGTDLYIVYNQNANVDRYSYNPVKRIIDSQTLIVKFSQTLIF